MPRFLADDLPLFNGIISDLYPNLEIPAVDYGELQTAIECALRKAGLQVVDKHGACSAPVHDAHHTLTSCLRKSKRFFASQSPR